MNKKSFILMTAIVFAASAATNGLWTYAVLNPTATPEIKTVSKPVVGADNKKPAKSATEKTAVKMTEDEFRDYADVIRDTANMTFDLEAQELCRKYGLNITNITWEDTGRYKGSAVGPNISDMTIQVCAMNPKTEEVSVTCMPVIRHPNFSDLTCDLDPSEFTLLVGNEKGKALKKISLKDFLDNPTQFLSNPRSWISKKKTLLAPRDSKVLVSAQACFLPIPKNGIAKFNPVLFNYQSYKENPAVLTLLATREGTSVTVIDNVRDAFSTGSVWGQRLFHNEDGSRASLTGERQSDFEARNQNSAVNAPTAAGETGLNMVLLIQVPLKQKRIPRDEVLMFEAAPAPGGSVAKSAQASDVENAVIGHGELEGVFTEIDGLEIERDPDYPIRVTVQFYKATSNGVVSDADVKAIRNQIDKVYANSEYVGSLVTEGNTGRTTEYYGLKIQPANWWEQFWKRYEKNTGISRKEAIERLRKLLGYTYEYRPVSDLYLRDMLKKEKSK